MFIYLNHALTPSIFQTIHHNSYCHNSSIYLDEEMINRFIFNGKEYSTYQDMVNAKRKRNEEHMQKLGFIGKTTFLPKKQLTCYDHEDNNDEGDDDDDYNNDDDVYDGGDNNGGDDDNEGDKKNMRSNYRFI